MTTPADTPAKRMIAKLAPLIEEHLAEAQNELRPRVIAVPDPRLLAVAQKVAEALGRLDSAKYTSGEIDARRSLERQARALRTALQKLPQPKKQEVRHG